MRTGSHSAVTPARVQMPSSPQSSGSKPSSHAPRLRSLSLPATSNTIAALLALVTFIASAIFFILKYRISVIGLELTQQAQRISIFKDCRDIPEINDILTCRKYMAAGYEAILKGEPRDRPPRATLYSKPARKIPCPKIRRNEKELWIEETSGCDHCRKDGIKCQCDSPIVYSRFVLGEDCMMDREVDDIVDDIVHSEL